MRLPDAQEPIASNNTLLFNMNYLIDNYLLASSSVLEYIVEKVFLQSI
jgi:hypothetical protein